LTGDFVATVVIDSMTLGNYHYAGLVALNPGDQDNYVTALARCADIGNRHFGHSTTDGAMVKVYSDIVLVDDLNYYQLERSGDTFTSRYSDDSGATWTDIQSDSRADLPATLYVGLTGTTGSPNTNTGPYTAQVESFQVEHVAVLMPTVDIVEDNIVTWLTDDEVDVSLTSVVTDGEGPDDLSFEWFVDGDLVEGATTKSIDLTELDLDLAKTLTNPPTPYVVKLVAFDGANTGDDSVTITVYADGCQAARETGSYTEKMARERGDTDYNCEVNLLDLAAMVENWLVDVSE
jgi:hypothetical protein